MLRYYKVLRTKDSKLWVREPITYDEALNLLLGTFRDNDMTRDMLTIPNRIQCLYSDVGVEDVDGKIVMSSQPGVFNLLPMDQAYDNDGNHI